MLKFMVVLYKKPELSEAEFHRFLRDVHGPMALKIPGLRKYINPAFGTPTASPGVAEKPSGTTSGPVIVSPALATKFPLP